MENPTSMRLISTYGFHQLWDIGKGVSTISTTILKWIKMVRKAMEAMPKTNSIRIKEVDTRLSIMVILTTPTWLMQ
jgi:hypothetical protein